MKTKKEQPESKTVIILTEKQVEKLITELVKPIRE